MTLATYFSLVLLLFVIVKTHNGQAARIEALEKRVQQLEARP